MSTQALRRNAATLRNELKPLHVTILDRYLVSELAGPALLGGAAFTLIFVATQILAIGKLVTEQHASLAAAIEYFLWDMPQFLLLDEPFTGIDPIAVADIQAMIRQLRDRGLGVLITDHQVRETLAIVDRAYILNDGKIEVSGSADDVLASPVARKFYLGEGFRL